MNIGQKVGHTDTGFPLLPLWGDTTQNRPTVMQKLTPRPLKCWRFKGTVAQDFLVLFSYKLTPKRLLMNGRKYFSNFALKKRKVLRITHRKHILRRVATLQIIHSAESCCWLGVHWMESKKQPLMYLTLRW